MADAEWWSCEHDDEPRDQMRDLAEGFWADVGPDERERPGGWSWTIMSGEQVITDGFADNEAAAKAAVGQWAAEHLS